MEEISVREALALAKIREENAKTFYEQSSQMVEMENAKKLLNDLAAEEEGHVNKITLLLEKITVEGKIPDARNPARNLRNVPEETAPVLDKNADFIEILRIAIDREQKAVKEYKNLADSLGDGEVKDLFVLLLNEEKRHLRRFEEDYDDFTDEMSHDKVRELILKMKK